MIFSLSRLFIWDGVMFHDKTDVYYSNWYGYDIKNALERFKEKAGNLPTKLVIKSHESGNNSNTEIPENYTEYTVEYKIASTNQ